MRVLITGINGFAGGYLATYLNQKQSTTLYGIDISPKGLGSEFEAEVFVGDLLDEAFVKKVLAQIRPDAIYHLAGQASVSSAWTQPWRTFELNVHPQLNLFKGMAELGLETRFLSVTSSKVYSHACNAKVPFVEDEPICPDNPYSLSKVTEDLMAFQYHLSHNLRVIRARPFNHIGPRQRPDFVTAAFARQIALAEAGLTPPLVKVGNLSAARDFSDVRDVVRAYVMLIEKGRPGEAYNIGSGRAVVIQDILDKLIALSRIEIKVEQDPERMRPVDQILSYGDTGKIKREIGWQPEIPLEDTLANILNYWRKQTSEGAGERVSG
ncbi:MAG TPA: NAD-dependent epimerase/dehydratase family protein [Chloroflexi bacterium]|nr:NAD-dependent epimerase/dehydratase family protein [Chloroflexota bacterium]